MKQNKNVWVIPTDKPSNGYILGKCIKELSDVKVGQFTKTYYLMFSEEYFQPQNIYITSDEEIKEGDWIFDIVTKKIEIAKFNHNDLKRDWKKIILTTDQELINDGVQAIDDEFLEWFVKNPSCEMVEVEEFEPIYGHQNNSSSILYKIIIPKEEPKQETIKDKIFQQNLVDKLKNGELSYQDASIYTILLDLIQGNGKDEVFRVFNEVIDKKPKQETLEEAVELFFRKKDAKNCTLYKAAKFGAKWQQERSYSEEDLRNAYRWGTTVNHGTKEHFNEWFEQFKKK